MIKTYVKTGDRIRIVLAYSEVCMHLQVAGKSHDVVILENMVQILDDNLRNISFPITPGEAGIYVDDEGMYYYA